MITKLTPEIIREFIENLVVQEKQKVDGKRTQSVEIVYNRIVSQVEANMGRTTE